MSGKFKEFAICEILYSEFVNKTSALRSRNLVTYSCGVTPKCPLQIHRKSSSTDCNIPLSLGIPALCIGVWTGGGAHTREEWIEKNSLPYGLEVGIKSVIALTEII